MALLLLAAAWVLAPHAAYACSCATAGLRAQVTDADSIGTAQVQWVTADQDVTTFGIRVTAVYRGRLGTTERVQTASNDAACGYRVQSGRRYLFFLRGSHGGELRVDGCGGTTPYDDGAARRVAAITGPAHRPLQVSLPAPGDQRTWLPTWLRWTLAGAGLVVVAGTVALARKP